jgi:outer membrane protein TolC
VTWQSRSLAFALALLSPGTVFAEGLKLEDAVRLALQNNERAQKAPLRVEVAEGQLDRARDAFFPTLVANGTSTDKPNPSGQTPALTHAGTVTLSQPLLNPSSFPLYWQQQRSLDSEKFGALQDKRQLAFDTAKAFVQALASEHVLDSAKRKADTAKLNLDESAARAQAGLTSTNDVTKAQLQLSTSIGQVASAQGNVDKAYIALSFLVGKKVDPPLVPPDATTKAAQKYEEAQRTETKSALDRHNDAIKAALDRRPDLRSLHEKTEALRYSAVEPLYRLAPTLSANGQMRFVPSPLASERAVDETITLNLTWQIFDAGFRYADRRQRVAQVSSSELDEKQLRRSVETDVDTARASLKAARASVESATEAVAAAKKNIEETLILYKQGLARALEVTDANDQQFQAEVTLETARLTMEQAYLDLRNALGYGPLDDDGSGGPK